MPVRARKTLRLGPPWLCVRRTLTLDGLGAWSVKVGPWSWNARTGRHTIDLPGAFRWESSTARQRARRRAARS